MEHTALETNNDIFEKPKSFFNNYSNRLKQCDDVSCGVSDGNFTDDIKSFYIVVMLFVIQRFEITQVYLYYD